MVPDGDAEDEQNAESATASESGTDEMKSVILQTVKSPSSSDPSIAHPPPTTAAQPTLDAIDEAPDAVWYVRPATGGQFGPASGEIMRSWLNEGRVGASSLVWRAGWAEWRAASAAFPRLGPALAPPAPVAPAKAAGAGNGTSVTPDVVLPVGQAVSVSGVPVSQNDSAASAAAISGNRKKRRRNDMSVLISVILVIISVILVIILVLVFPRQTADDAQKNTQSTRRETAPTRGPAAAGELTSRAW
jgi:hypothetical protein